MILTCKSPYTVIAKVRGIGVAVITRICGGWVFLFHSLARCATPKRCCSSMIHSPRLANCTVSSINACVPMRILISPERSCSWIGWRCLAVVEPVRRATLGDEVMRQWGEKVRMLPEST